jgi:pimeloyl-ACP methyl ester carboxylesterase
MADFTLALLDALDLDRVALLGHDMGGAVALRCALERPERVAGVIVCSAGDRFELAEEAAAAMQRVRDGKARRAFDPTIFAKKTGQDVMKQVFMEGLKTDPRATHGDLVACAAWDDRDRLADVKAPALVIHGDEDHAPVQTAARSLVDRLPSADLVTVPDAGHAILFEAPGALADRVRSFLEALPA